MSLPAAAMLFVCQALEPTPPVGEAGAETVVVAHRDGEPIAGLEVLVHRPGGSVASLGITGPDGSVRMHPEVEGDYELRARLPAGGPLLVVAYHVAPRPRRWLWALFCTPAGLALLAWNLRRRRRAGDRLSEPRAGASGAQP